jgi:hypothetical protein
MRNHRGRMFVDHGGIWLLELSEFAAETVETANCSPSPRNLGFQP